MSEQKVKSNAPWILGIVGIFLTILHYACAVLCSAAVGDATEFSEKIKSTPANVALAAGEVATTVGGVAARASGHDGAASDMDDLTKTMENKRRANTRSAEDKGKETFNVALKIANTSALIMLGCFILSFFGKSGISGITGFLLIIGGIAGAILSVVHLSIAGIAAGIVYLCSGISSICNRKKIKG